MNIDENYLLNLYKERFYLSAEKKYNQFLADYLSIYFPQLQVGSKILEIGFGNGMFLKELENRGFKTYGMDISTQLVSVVGKFIKAELKVGDINEILPYEDGFFDAVVLFAVLEYAEDYNRSIKEIQRVLKNNGIIFISVLNSRSILHYLLGKRWSWYQDKYHVHMFDENKLRTILINSGFEILSIRTAFNFYLAGATTRILRLFRPLKKVIFIPKFGDELFCIARKK
jgi:SAM-dependent methyltransferase